MTGRAVYWLSAAQEIARNLRDLPESDFDHIFFDRRYYHRKLLRAMRIVDIAQFALFTGRTVPDRTVAVAKLRRAKAH